MTQSQRPIHLVFGLDNNYAMPLGVTIQSALANLHAGSIVQLWVIDGGVSHGNKRRLAQVIERNEHVSTQLIWLSARMAAVDDLKTTGHMTSATYLSMLIPELLPVHIDRAIYLDCDLLVQADLNQLWLEASCTKMPLSAVQDYLIATVSDSGGIIHCEQLGLPPTARYLNAGVLVYNLARWRTEQLSQQIFAYMRTYHETLILANQEGVNALLADRWHPLDLRWNVQSAFFERAFWPKSELADQIEQAAEALRSSGYIYHFTGPMKPWHSASGHLLKPIWMSYLAQTQWFDSPPLGATTDRRPAQQVKHTARPSTSSEPEKAKVTVAIPTHNRSIMLQECVVSVFQQSLPDWRIWVLNNASGDETHEVIQSLDDARVSVTHNDINVGYWGSVLQIMENEEALSSSEYLLILPDDDRLLPNSLQLAIGALERHPEAVFAFGPAVYTDVDGTETGSQSYTQLAPGQIPGDDLLREFVDNPAFMLHPAALLMRVSAIADARKRGLVSEMRVGHAKQLNDITFWLRLATGASVYCLENPLAIVRQHSGQSRAALFRSLDGLQTLGMLGVRIEAVSRLLSGERDLGHADRAWLAEQLLSLNQQRSSMIQSFVPVLQVTHIDQRRQLAQVLATVIPVKARFVLIGESLWIAEAYAGRLAVSLIEKDGQYWGAPPDDSTAIDALAVQIALGATFLVISQHAYWWFEHYRDFTTFIRMHYQCVKEDASVTIFDLTQRSQLPPGGSHE